MAVIRARVEIGAPAERVWAIISDLDGEPRFWKGTKSVRNISRQGDVITREVTIAFQDRKCMQKVTLHPREGIEIVFTGGIIQGTKSVAILPGDDHTVLQAVWDVRLSGVMGVFTGIIKGHIESGTQHALQEIKKEAEGGADAG